MKRTEIVYQTCLEILKRELVSAMGCTEPIALAYCAAVARSVLGALPDRITVEASGNIIKNVKSVVVPNTGGQRGIAAAACVGALGGDALAVEHYRTLEKKAADCVHCGHCDRRCPFGVKQSDRMREIDKNLDRQ